MRLSILYILTFGLVLHSQANANSLPKKAFFGCNSSLVSEKDYQDMVKKYNDCKSLLNKYNNTHCMSKEEYEAIILNLENLIINNKLLEEQVLKFKEFQQATPEITLDELKIVIDKDGHVFVLDNLNGKLQIKDLNYDINIKLNTTIVKTKQREYGLNLAFKAAVVQNFERQPDSSIKDYLSPAVAIEPFYIKYFNANIVIGPRIYGLGLGVDITNHMDFLAGLGLRYDDKKTFFTGLAFDF